MCMGNTFQQHMTYYREYRAGHMITRQRSMCTCWLAGGTCVLLVVTICVSAVTVITWVSCESRMVLQTYAGLLSVGWPEMPPLDFSVPEDGLDAYRVSMQLLFAPHTMVDSYGYRHVSIPLWIPLVVALAVLVWTLRGRHRGPVHMACSKCSYDLTGNVSGRCPECGQRIDADGRRCSEESRDQ